MIIMIFGTALPACALGWWPRAPYGQGMLLRGIRRGASHVWVGAAAPGSPGRQQLRILPAPLGASLPSRRSRAGRWEETLGFVSARLGIAFAFGMPVWFCA